jgi:hypothetical protein
MFLRRSYRHVLNNRQRGSFNSVGKETLSKDIVSCMTEAGIDVSIFKAHSIRGAAASKMRDEGALVVDHHPSVEQNSCLITGRLASLGAPKAAVRPSGGRPLVDSLQLCAGNAVLVQSGPPVRFIVE